MTVSIALALSLVLAACGGGGDSSEPTATAVPALAQPTSETVSQAATVAATPPPPVVRNTVPPRNTDMSSPNALTSVTATPGPDVPENESPTGVVGEIDGQATPMSAAATPVDASTGDVDTSSPSKAGIADGTGGASLATLPQDGDDVAMGTPEAAASPVAPAATPAGEAATAGAEVPAVTSCAVDDVPAFTGDITSYVLAVDLNFRTGPGADCDLIGNGPLGEFSAVEVVGGPVTREGDDSGEWVQVRVGDDLGWLAFEFLEPAE